jgi:hypothetical protein
MPHIISRFVKFLVGSRLAQCLFLVHLTLVVYAVGRLPLANPDYWGSGGGCHGVPLADRVLFYCDSTGLLGVIATVDIIAIALFGVFATFFFWVPSIGFHAYSWIVSVVLLIVTSFQWLLIGACVEWLLRRSARTAHV